MIRKIFKKKKKYIEPIYGHIPSDQPRNDYSLEPSTKTSSSKKKQSKKDFTKRTSELEDRNLYVALHDYEPRTDEDLGFIKGENFEVLNKVSEGWWYAKSKLTGREGYIPASYVAELGCLEAEEWYFGVIRRVDTERLLLSDFNTNGAFLIRNSEQRENEFSLSVRDGLRVRHYKIMPTDNGGFFISRQKIFSSLNELVSFYIRDSTVLNSVLRKPCQRHDKPSTAGLAHNTWNEWEIAREQIQLGDRIGSGNFGMVYKALWNGHYNVAVKTFQADKMQAADFLEEAHFLKRLKHKNLLHLLGVCTLGEPIYIITELMKNGCLLDYLRELRRNLGFQEQIHIAIQIAAGMEYLEGLNYIHRDLAARNVLVGDELSVKVADFGLSRLIGEEVYEAKQSNFPVRWTAPEALHFRKFSSKSDVWSFGVLLMEIVTKGGIPYPGMSNNEVARKVNTSYRMPKPMDCPDDMYTIMQETWAQDPQHRPTFSTLRSALEDYLDIENAKTENCNRADGETHSGFLSHVEEHLPEHVNTKGSKTTCPLPSGSRVISAGKSSVSEDLQCNIIAEI